MVEVARPEQRRISEWQEFSARPDAVETVEIRPRITGHLQEVRFQAGRHVKKGDVLFAIDPRWHGAASKLAESRVAQVQVRRDATELEAKHAEELLKTKAISVEEGERGARLLSPRRPNSMPRRPRWMQRFSTWITRARVCRLMASFPGRCSARATM